MGQPLGFIDSSCLLINTKNCTCNKDKSINFSFKVLINALITYKLYECSPNKLLC